MGRKRKKAHRPREQKRAQQEVPLEEFAWDFAVAADAGEAATLGLYEEFLRLMREGANETPCDDEPPCDPAIYYWGDDELSVTDPEPERLEEDIADDLAFEIPF